MNLTEQVCAVEQAARLRELGVTDRPVFVWVGGGQNGTWLEMNTGQNHLAPAYTVAELHAMLPDGVSLMRYQKGEIWRAGKDGDYAVPTVRKDTPANALATMLIYLLENKLIEAHV